MDLRQQKTLARQSVAERLVRMNDKDRAVESRSIVRRILEHLPADSGAVCAYMPMRTEPDIRPVLEHLLQQGIPLYLPRTEGKAFTFRKVESLDALEKGPFGILEPTAEAEELDLKRVEIALVPGVAFDRDKNRLGRGNGGYDKWLLQLRGVNQTAAVWGIAFEAQIINTIPMEPHDAKVDAIVTARGIGNR